MKAIKVQGPKEAKLVDDAPIPTLRPGYLLVKIVAVALNPTDWKHIHYRAPAGCTVGCDYSGIVEEVGPGVEKPFKKGDRVAGWCHGSNALQLEDGAFGEYAVAFAHGQLKIPDNMSFEDAATLGVGLITTGQALYQSLGLPWPNAPAREKFPVLIYGASTASGLFMVQFAKLSGLEVIATCSPRNFDLVKSFGADAVFDYSDGAKCAEEIRAYTKDNLKYVSDCISTDSSEEICANAISSDGKGAKYNGLLGEPELPRSDIEAKHTIAYSAKGEELLFGKKIPGMKDHKEFTSKFMTMANEYLFDGKIKTFATVRSGGLQGVFEGLDDLRNGKVSASKLVYKIEDTKL